MSEQALEINQIDIPEIEELETHSELDERALLAELDGEDFDPDSVVKRKDPKENLALETGKQTTLALLGAVEQGLKTDMTESFLSGMKSLFEESLPNNSSGKSPRFFGTYTSIYCCYCYTM